MKSAATTDSLEARREDRVYRQMFRGELPPNREKSDEPIPLPARCDFMRGDLRCCRPIGHDGAHGRLVRFA